MGRNTGNGRKTGIRVVYRFGFGFSASFAYNDESGDGSSISSLLNPSGCILRFCGREKTGAPLVRNNRSASMVRRVKFRKISASSLKYLEYQTDEI